MSCLAHFLIIESAFGSAGGPTFVAQKRFGPPKVPQEAPPWKSPHFLDRFRIREIVFCIFFDLLGYVFQHRFLLSSGSTFYGFGLYLDTFFSIFLH